MRTSRIARLATSILATSILATAPACDDDGPEANATFATATAEQRVMAVGAAHGEAFGIATILTLGVATAGSSPTATCPKVTTSGKKVTIQGGCAVGELRIDGSATIDNLSLTDDDEDGPESFGLSWNDFTLSTGPNKIRIDGSVDVDSTATKGDVVADFEIEVQGHVVALDGTMTCTATSCSASAGSFVTVKGVGGAEIKGTWASDENAAPGSLELHGKDVLKVDFAKADAAGCYATTIDDKATSAVCLGTEDDEGDDDSDGSLRSLGSVRAVLDATRSVQ